LVNNAGVGKHGLLAYSTVPIQGVGNSMLDTTEAEWDHIVNVDAKAVFFTMQKVIPVMVQQGRGGRIINVGSAAWKYHPFPSTSDGAYAAAKASVIVMSKTASVQFARHNINVNVVTPGTTRTAQWDLGLKEQSKRTGIPFDDLVKRGEARIPVGRMNEPEDVAYMVVFLAGSKALNITGQEFTVDGGLTMH
jgi:NAD(P)-dependent dehydrogenase (short-subunit alcohol dehydrogenase family)